VWQLGEGVQGGEDEELGVKKPCREEAEEDVPAG